MSSSSIIGQTLGNKYKIVELLGKGGMATVYKGYQAGIDRYVAIKILPPHPGQDDEYIRRFEQEARLIARLQHPHILPVYDYGADGEILYLAIAFVEGGSLADRIDNGPVPIAQVERYLREVSAALDYAHRQGIVHRDIKPDNILINAEGYTLLADFGIAKLAGGESKLTATGGMVGTPAYMAPEQARGGTIGPAADIYSLGVVTYEMLTGRQPFTADTPLQLVMKHVTEPVPDIADVMRNVPPALTGVMLRVMAKNAADRYDCAIDFYEDFSRAVQGQDVRPDTARFAATAVMAADQSGTLQLPQSPTAAGRTRIAEPAPTLMTSGSSNSLLLIGGLAVIALLVVAVIVLVIFVAGQRDGSTTQDVPTAVAQEPTAVVTTVPTFGRATFSTAISIGDTFNLRVERLPLTGAGVEYIVWLVNTEADETLKAGSLTVDGLGNGVMTFTDLEGRLLPGAFNAIAITREEDPDSESPAGETIYSGVYSIEYAGALQAILAGAEDGIDGKSYVQSAMTEAGTANQHSNLAAGATNIGGVLTHTEHTINILLGTEDDYNENGRGENPGRGFGVDHFLDLIEAQLDTALALPGTSIQLQSEAELIRVCMENARLTIDEMVTVLKTVLEAETPEASVEDRAEVVRLADILVNGTDADGNGQVEPFEGECSLGQIETFGVLAGVLDLVAGPLE